MPFAGATARPREGRRRDPRGAEDAAGPAGRLSHAGCARRRAVRRQGAGAEEPRDELHAGRAPAEAAPADGRADALDDHRHDADRGGGAAARSAADQALSARLQRASSRRQKLSVHPASRGSRLPAGQKHRGARRAKGQYFGPFASAGSVTRRSMRCRSCSCYAAAPTAISRTGRGPACFTRSSAARRHAWGGSARPTMTSWSRMRRTSWPASRPASRRGCRSRWP